MRLVADLHVHSRYSRATSKDADLEGYFRWARLKGINVVGTGDFTHPRWLAELAEKLVEKDGLYALKAEPSDFPVEGAQPAEGPVRFLLTVEISSIYKKRGQTRKVHTLLGVRTMEEARKLGARLATIGNIASDGRPILGLDPKDLLSILLETAPEGFLIPAHIWTPWFSLFGSKSGFDSIEECFEELTPHIFALETGLSSDPLMNWRWSALDRYRLVSNSDAHSPPNLGREANLLEAGLDWEGVVSALRTGAGFLGTCEFYPEEGKYHFDGHRKCGVRLDPEETLKAGGKCPACGAPLTVGVLHRVLELADRKDARRPRDAAGFRYLIPVPEMLSQLTGSGVGSRVVTELHARVIRAFGSEYAFLFDSALEEVRRSLGPLIGEAVSRMRDGRVSPVAGYDGEFGVIRMFDEAELALFRGQDELFPASGSRAGRAKRGALARPVPADSQPPGRGAQMFLFEAASLLDAAQKDIVSSPAQRCLVFAGPGTGKTRLLAAWIAGKVQGGAARADQVLSITFTTRAAAEMRDRLSSFLGRQAAAVSATTFHSFCFSVLRARDPRLLAVYNPSQRIALLSMLPQGGSPSAARAAAERLERYYEGMTEVDQELGELLGAYEALCASAGGVDISSLVTGALQLFQENPDVLREWQEKYPVSAVDELQDINRPQFQILSLLSGNASSVLCIGDPDQAIYGFRGSDRGLFSRFLKESGATPFALSINYRSGANLVRAAAAIIEGKRSPGIPALSAARTEGSAIRTYQARDPEDEGDFIASTIRDLLGGVDAVSVDSARERVPGNHSFADIAVLFRTRVVRDALLPSLLRAGLPLAFRDNTPLALEPPFRFLVAALRLILNPHDLVSRKELSESLAGRDNALAAFLARLDELRHRAASAGVEAVIDELEKDVVPIDRSVPEIDLADEAIRESARDCGRDLAAFLVGLSLLTRESEGAARAEKVTLLTFHAAKGLEFPVVFIAGAEEGIVPLADDPEEERRLFYVAVTRARDVLYVTHCARRGLHGVVRPARPSPFLADIPADCLQEAPAVRSARSARNVQLGLFT